MFLATLHIFDLSWQFKGRLPLHSHKTVFTTAATPNGRHPECSGLHGDGGVVSD